MSGKLFLNQMSDKTYDIVVARYNENIDWVKKYKNCLLYNKGEHIQENYIKLENVGREAHTYLYHIVKNYNTLSDHTIFVQANPFDHSPNFFDTLDGIISSNFSADFYWISEKLIVGDFTYKREPYILPAFPNINPAYEFIFGDAIKPETFVFGAGAQFSVSKDRILSRPLEFYQKIFDVFDKEVVNNSGELYTKLLRLPDNNSESKTISRKTPELAYHLERFWGIMFSEV